MRMLSFFIISKIHRTINEEKDNKSNSKNLDMGNWTVWHEKKVNSQTSQFPYHSYIHYYIYIIILY